MIKYPKRSVTKWDVILISVLIFITVFLHIKSYTTPIGDVFTVDSENSFVTYPLSEDAIIPIANNGYTIVITVENGTVSVTESSCPDHVCQKSHPISKEGSSIVCVPAKIVISIPDGNGGTQHDFIVG